MSSPSIRVSMSKALKAVLLSVSVAIVLFTIAGGLCLVAAVAVLFAGRRPARGRTLAGEAV